jgi:hypothetical protein
VRGGPLAEITLYRGVTHGMELRLYRYPEWQETEYKCILLKRNTSFAVEERAEPVSHEGRMDESLSRSRRNIRDTILCNRFDLFCTFTFDKEKVKDRTDYRDLKKKFSKFLNNFRNRYDPNFRYLYVPELHEDGAVHMHGVMSAPIGLCSPLTIQYRDIYGNLRTGKNTKGYMDWPHYSEKFGFFSCSWIRNYTGCAIYVSKYMTKDLAKWFERGDQIVMKSKGLKKPELVHIDYESGIPGAKQPDDYSGEYCDVAMRNAWDVKDIYFSGDDSWQRYENHPYPQEVVASPELVTDLLLSIFPSRWKEMPGMIDSFEQVTMYAQNKRV